MTSEGGTGKELPLVARRLDALFRTHLPKDGKGREYSYAEVAKAINDVAGEKSISHAYIWQLRTGKSPNPTLRSLQLLAAFFSVPVTYFFDDAEAARLAEQIDLVSALSDGLVRQITLRCSGLSDASLSAILAMVDNARKLEGLPGNAEA
jgi:transcriptional regulator with XRE-family HTH domain